MAHYPKINTGINYRSYVCQLSQANTDDPIPVVLHNNLGYIPTWSRNGTGYYTLNATEFDNEENDAIVLFFNTGNFVSAPMDQGFSVHAVWNREVKRIEISSAFYDGSTTGFSPSDNLLSDSANDDFFRANFELRIYKI